MGKGEETECPGAGPPAGRAPALLSPGREGLKAGQPEGKGQQVWTPWEWDWA